MVGTMEKPKIVKSRGPDKYSFRSPDIIGYPINSVNMPDGGNFVFNLVRKHRDGDLFGFEYFEPFNQMSILVSGELKNPLYSVCVDKLTYGTEAYISVDTTWGPKVKSVSYPTLLTISRGDLEYLSGVRETGIDLIKDGRRFNDIFFKSR